MRQISLIAAVLMLACSSSSEPAPVSGAAGDTRAVPADATKASAPREPSIVAPPTPDAAPTDPVASLSGDALGAALDQSFGDIEAAELESNKLAGKHHAAVQRKASAEIVAELAQQSAKARARITTLKELQKRLLARAVDTDLLAERAVMQDGKIVQAWWEEEFPCEDGEKFVGAPPPHGNRVYCKDPTVRYRRRITQFHPNGYKRHEATANAKGEHGVTTDWYNNGVRREATSWVDDQLHGSMKTWYRNGQLSATGGYRHGLLHGPWLMYAPDGKQLFATQMKKGSGRYRQYRDDGTLRLEGAFRRGKEHGIWLLYDRDGKAVERWLFKHGERTKKTVLAKYPHHRSAGRRSPRRLQ